MAWIFTTDGDYVNFNGGGNLWRLHKDSACISWHWDESGDLFFDVYDQEYYVKAGNIADVVINGTPLSAASGFPAAIQAVFTGLYSPGGGGGVESVTAGDASITVGGTATDPTVKLPYKVYTALLTQSDTDAPVATVLANTLGDTPAPQFNSTGFFKLFSLGLFPANKVVCFAQIDWNNQVLDEYIVSAARITDNEIGIFVFNSSFAPQNGFGNLQIEVRIYP